MDFDSPKADAWYSQAANNDRLHFKGFQAAVFPWRRFISLDMILLVCAISPAQKIDAEKMEHLRTAMLLRRTAISCSYIL